MLQGDACSCRPKWPGCAVGKVHTALYFPAHQGVQSALDWPPLTIVVPTGLHSTQDGRQVPALQCFLEATAPGGVGGRAASPAEGQPCSPDCAQVSGGVQVLQAGAYRRSGLIARDVG